MLLYWYMDIFSSLVNKVLQVKLEHPRKTPPESCNFALINALSYKEIS